MSSRPTGRAVGVTTCLVHVPTLRLPAFLPLIAMALAYFATAGAALHVFGESTPIWFPNALAVVFLLRQPLANWPVGVAAAWVADALAIALFGHGTSILVSAADVLEICLVAGLVQATGGVREPVFEGGQMLRVLAACVLGPAVSAAAGSALLSAQLGIPFADAWHTWYSASALGLVIVAPFLLSWLDRRLRAKSLAPVGARHALLLLAGALLAALLLHVPDHQAVLFFTFPILFGLAWAYGLVGATVGMLLVAASAIWTTLQGTGALATLVLPATDLGERIESLQIYLAAMLLSSLPLALLHAQQRELAARLQQSGEARTEFLAAMSHEIRTPMTGVLGMVDLLAAEPLEPRQRNYVEAMRSSGRHLLSVINDVLDFSRIESGKLELEDVNFSLPDMLERLRSIVHPLAVERGLELRVQVEPGLPEALRGDPLRLRQVLLNLVSNAIKFTGRGGVDVWVSRRHDPDEGDRLRFEVRDTGVGIDPAKLEQLFLPFTQADRSISRQYGGSGLGLAISKRLVDAMGGRIGARSIQGAGSVFSFELPLRAGDPRKVPQPTEAGGARIAPLHILVAEDVEINREILRAALGGQGHHLSFAKDGVEALQLVQRREFDVVLMDVQMPLMDGVEATRRIRKLPAPAGQVPILGLTANVMAREREGCLGAGMDDCLAKPIDWPALHAALARVAGAPPAPGAEAAVAPMTTPLLDERAIDALRRMASAAELAELLQVGMQGYDAACAAMQDAQASAEDIGRQAHKLKGSSGTLGLAAICAIAAQLEEAADRGEAARHLVPQLRDTIEATRAELARRGLCKAPATAARAGIA